MFNNTKPAHFEKLNETLQKLLLWDIEPSKIYYIYTQDFHGFTSNILFVVFKNEMKLYDVFKMQFEKSPFSISLLKTKNRKTKVNPCNPHLITISQEKVLHYFLSSETLFSAPEEAAALENLNQGIRRKRKVTSFLSMKIKNEQ